MIRLLRSLGMGALLGAGLVGLFWGHLAPFLGPVNSQVAMLGGGLVGAALHHPIAAIGNYLFVRPLRPWLSVLELQSRIWTVEHAVERGWIRASRAEEMLEDLVENHLIPPRD